MMTMNFLQRLVALRPAVPSEVDGSLSCFYCGEPFYSSTDEDDASKHAPDCLYVEAVKALADASGVALPREPKENDRG
jgi:hypothetical protein